MMTAQRRKGLFLIVLSAFAFGWMPIFGSWAYADSGVDTQGLLLIRFSLAGLVMATVMLLRLATWPRGRTLLGLIAMGGIGYVGQAFCYFSALRHGSAALAALLLYVYPVLVTLACAFWWKEKLSPRTWAALALACVSLILTIGPAGGQWLGVAFGLSAAVIYSGYIIAGSRLTPLVGALPAATVVMLSAACCLWLSTLWSTPSWPSSSTSWLAAIAIALLSTVVAIFAFLAGLDYLSASEASTLSTLEPVISVLLAALILGEKLSALQWLGGMGILIAAILIALAPVIPAPE
ncbi:MULTISPECIES: DMT family transporter [Deefgea]|uniref:EamA family transporter n=1 Tax=Deefgea chitinilytica TaxID=570276 RepID=A0ABS2CDK5_9NEIS|nr:MULTISPECIES: DMT family transporter [Deefgea]MBM5572216.1 EamA family transporter [Deefgea chitinilytica]MBM9889451.1 DMT family transporter [Deefgea sp. CFH1-16]